jgi:pimeloyl-ACP methyl ester carboxylesterase
LLVALEAASKRPNPISSLILIDSVAYAQTLPGFIKILRVPVLAQLLVCLVPNRLQALQVLRQAYHDAGKITAETVEAYSAPLSLPGAHNALIETAKQIIPQDIEEISSRYATIRTPALLVWGSHDRIVDREVGERLQRAMPNSDLVVIDGVGHVPQEEAPGATLKAMQKFLLARP